jgi:hypothetical protein
LKRAFIGPTGELREEDVQKVAEVTPLLAELARTLSKGPCTIVDACAGKSTVGVLAAALLGDLHVHAIERDPVRSRLLEEGARALGVRDRVTLVARDVRDAEAWSAEPRTVIALHACGDASDLAIERAIAAGAKHVLAVPCCYGSARERASPFMAAPVARKADQVRIDVRRTLALEAAGYQTEVVELFSPTVSPFHLLWRARFVGEPVRMERAKAELTSLKEWRRPPCR